MIKSLNTEITDMVDVVGHLGMALIWLAVAWLVFDRAKTAMTFVGVGFWFGLLPDSDLYLRRIFETVKHHGVIHTVLVVTIIAAVLGPLIGWIFKQTLGDTQWLSPSAVENRLSFGFLMVWIAGLSHLFADMLSAPDISEPIEPLWPIYQQSLGLDVVWYSNPWVNWGLLFFGIGLNVALHQWKRNSSTDSTDHP